MKKHIIALILILALALCGCGSSDARPVALSSATATQNAKASVSETVNGKTAEQWAWYAVAGDLADEADRAVYSVDEATITPGAVQPADEITRMFFVRVYHAHGQGEEYDVYIVRLDYHGGAERIPRENISRLEERRIESWEL